MPTGVQAMTRPMSTARALLLLLAGALVLEIAVRMSDGGAANETSARGSVRAAEVTILGSAPPSNAK